VEETGTRHDQGKKSPGDRKKILMTYQAETRRQDGGTLIMTGGKIGRENSPSDRSGITEKSFIPARRKKTSQLKKNATSMPRDQSPLEGSQTDNCRGK